MSPERVAALSVHRPALEGYLTRLTGDPDLASDAAQEAYARLHRRPPQHADNLRAWLFTVATNHALDTVRVSRRRLEILERYPEACPMGRCPVAPDEAVEREERRAIVRQAMMGLRDKERRVLTMRAEGSRYREIAMAVGIPVNSVGVVAARALRKLAVRLTPQRGVLE